MISNRLRWFNIQDFAGTAHLNIPGGGGGLKSLQPLPIPPPPPLPFSAAIAPANMARPTLYSLPDYPDTPACISVISGPFFKIGPGPYLALHGPDSTILYISIRNCFSSIFSYICKCISVLFNYICKCISVIFNYICKCISVIFNYICKCIASISLYFRNCIS